MSTNIRDESGPNLKTLPALPRFHHAAYVSSDQERTRHFYEDILGMELTGFWVEHEVIGGIAHEFSLSLYALGDGSALSFFNFADPEIQQQHAAHRQGLFVHLALRVNEDHQEQLRCRLHAAGLEASEFDHGYARSLYVQDPDGQMIEFAVEPELMDSIAVHQRATAHEALRRWQGGDRTVNNTLPRQH
ncbi:VOC family protein [Sphingosinicella sp. BN140058]|uniref:VOC family protein n=1 Tax=Sphingosinicella sp. BN140058 TaxID=1892855 RepID=UPI00101276A9|nr:VOC family protein [Sphingosinicella sp. BN140058]QAY76327.1 VOC family protein [Sphingosinicella sp. BN140058]